MRIFKAKKKKVIEGRDKPIWIDAAYTMLIGEYQGRTTYSLIDERTGERYNLFEWEKDKKWDKISPTGPRPEPNDSPTDYSPGEEVVPF